MVRTVVQNSSPLRLLAAAALASAVASGLAVAGHAAGRAGEVAAVVISGHGIGHGAGLSQWGAEERAAAGQDARRILAFYYPHTRVARTAGRTVRVLLATRARVRVGSSAPFTIVEAGGARIRMRPGGYRLGAAGIAGLRVRLPLRVLPGAEPLRLGGTRYAGTFSIDRADGALRVVNTVGLEAYVAGVVTSECPGYWPREALRAQAIASRSYVLANLQPGEPFDVYADSRSQNYRGLARAFPSAVAATSSTEHEVLEYDGRVVDAVFSASNGGMTSDGVALIGHALPYLVARPDPFDARSPAAAWGPLRFTLPQLRARFPQLPGDIAGVQAVESVGARVAQLTFVGSDGTRFETSGFEFQQRLHLNSTYLTLTPEYDPAAA